ncbi:MAG: hypothetical protein ABL921_32725, partial [Pirellula sp.]
QAQNDSLPSPTDEAEEEITTNDITAVASSADIEALFAQINSKKQPATVPAITSTDTTTNAPTSSPTEALTPAVESPNSLEAVNKTEVASADDIAALFATHTQAPKPAVPIVSNEAETQPVAQPAPAATPTPPLTPVTVPAAPTPAPVDLNEAATADDIAALFATVKSAVKPIPPEAAVSTAEPSQPAAVLPSGDQLSESASSDDIEALFAAMKK